MKYKIQNLKRDEEKIKKVAQQAAELIDASDVNGIEALNILGILLSFFVEQMAKHASSKEKLEEVEINVALFLTQKVARILVERRLQFEGKLAANP